MSNLQMIDLPNELLVQILKGLSFLDLIHCSLVSFVTSLMLQYRPFSHRATCIRGCEDLSSSPLACK